MTTVSFVMPVRNEERYIHASLQSLVSQIYPYGNYEILVVDGRSSDRTRDIVEEFRVARSPGTLFRQSGRHCADCHEHWHPSCNRVRDNQGRWTNVYPLNYAENCVKYLQQTGAANVGGPWITVPANDSLSAQLVAAILSSPFGVGNSKFRTGMNEGFVDTVPFGAFRREVFDTVGFYNEKLVRNQDNELNARIRKAGGTIYLTPALTTHYYPVKRFGELLRYAFKTSQWHIFTLRENSGSMGLRHLAPAAFLLALLMLLAATISTVLSPIFLATILFVYILVGSYFSLRTRSNNSWGVRITQPFANFVFHIAYGLGTLAGLRYLFRQPPLSPIRA